MSTEHDFLASAYLDGELTDEERRIAEADPAVMAEVDELRALRAQLAAVEPPSAAARDSAIAAALGAFHELYGAAEPVRPVPAPAPANVVTFRRRPIMAHWLNLAAAVLIVAALGFVVVAGLRGGGDDDSGEDLAAVSEPAAAEPAAEEPAAEARLTEDSDATAMVAEAGTEEPAAEMATADAPTEQPAQEPAEEPAADEPAMAPLVLIDPALNVDEGVPIDSPAQLAAVATFLLQREADGELGATPEHRCPFERVLDEATWTDGGPPVDVLIDVDDADNVVRAIDRSTCDVLVETPIAS